MDQRVPRIVIISPCRDEEDNLPATIASMVGQSLMPERWVVVDDGSTDRTPEILAAAAAEHDFLRVVTRTDRGKRSVGPGVIDAFYAGLETVDLDDFDYVMKLDSDLELPPDYLRLVTGEMEKDSALGNFSGKVWTRLGDGSLMLERMGDENAVGAIKFYRVACFLDIGGFVREVSWDGIDGHTCRMKGWVAASRDEPDLRVIQRRLMGTSDKGIWTGRARWGRGKHFMGSALYYVMAVSVYRAFDKPLFVAGLGILWGYLKAMFTGANRYENPEFRKCLRRFELSSLVRGKRRTTEKLNREIRESREAAG